MEFQARRFLKQLWLKKSKQLEQLQRQNELDSSIDYPYLLPDAGTLDLLFPPPCLDMIRFMEILQDSYRKDGDLRARKKFEETALRSYEGVIDFRIVLTNETGIETRFYLHMIP